MTWDRLIVCSRCGRERMHNYARPLGGMCRDCQQLSRQPMGTWPEGAACAGSDTNAFYSLQKDQQAQAKAICDTCPVALPCLAYALANNEEGIWGGMTEDERRRMQGKRLKYYERGVPRTPAPKPPPKPRRPRQRRDDPDRVTVRKDGDWWAVTHKAQEAKAASWDAAIDFANRIASTN